MSKIFTVEPTKFIENLAKELKGFKDINPPEWSKFCKTGVHKERCPIEKDWWYIRAAAVLRSIFKLGPIGTEKLRTKYGGRKDRGVKPEYHKKGSGSIIRKLLQQLESSNLIKQSQIGKRKGRIITKEGKELLNKIADIDINIKTNNKENKSKEKSIKNEKNEVTKNKSEETLETSSNDLEKIKSEIKDKKNIEEVKA